MITPVRGDMDHFSNRLRLFAERGEEKSEAGAGQVKQPASCPNCTSQTLNPLK